MIDQNVHDWQILVNGLPPGSEILLLNDASSGLDQIAAALQGRHDVASLHIISHGSADQITLGSDVLESGDLVQHQAQLRAIGSSLTADGDILLYGCNVSRDGSSLIETLAQITGADIAASTDATGASRLGGNWVLESASGRIDATSIVVAAFDELLAAPANTVPGAQTVAEDNTITFGVGKIISIADADGTVQSVSVSVAHGTLTLSGITGLTLSGNGTGTISITGGSIANINGALNGLVYRPTANYGGPDTLTIVTNDGSTTDTDTVAITVSPNATAPVLTLPATAQTVTEDVASYLDFTATNAIVLSDADANDLQTLTLSVANGTLNINTTVSGGVTSATGNGTGSVILSGTAAQLAATLADTQGIQYTSTLNYNSSYVAAGAEALSFSLSDGVAAHDKSGTVTINVTQVNDAPTFTGAVNATVQEGGQVTFFRTQLASGDNALDVDILTGQQVIGQLMVTITSLPTLGSLSYKGGPVIVGTVVPVSDLANLKYTHNGTDIVANANDTFNVTVTDGGGGSTNGSIGVTITPKNVAPSISGSPSLIEGQVKVVAPTISMGDGADTLANSIIVIDNIITGGQGTLFVDANNNNAVDIGEALSGSTTLTLTQRSNLASQLKFFQNGAEPNAIGAISPSFRITVTDAGGGTGIPSAPVAQTITITVQPNNDDPTLLNTHASPGAALTATEGAVTAITSAMLMISDGDLNPADLSQTTPEYQLVYTIETRPTQGEVQIFIGGGLGYGADGWITLGDGGRFTQAQVAAGQVRYYQTVNVADGAATPDNFTFTVRDSAYGYDVWTDPANPTSNREGGLRTTATGAIATQQFFIDVAPLATSSTPREVLAGSWEGAPRPATSGFGGTNLQYDFVPTGGMLSNNSIAAGAWEEANVSSGGSGYVISTAMLSYTITRTDTMGTPATGDDISVTVPTNETVYTLTSQPGNGLIQSHVSGSWQTIPINGQFTQADIDAGNVRFVHDGSENHASSFAYTVSDGTPNHYTGTFGLDITPTNDRPTGGGGTVQVVEKSLDINPANDGLLRLGASAIGLSDVDLSHQLGKQTGEGAQDFLWFQIQSQPTDAGATQHGVLERWNGAAWVTVLATEWLPSTLLAAAADGATSGLRYAHDGSEPLAYPTAPQVTFTYLVRDDLANPANPFAVDTVTPVADVSGSAQSNQSAAATTTIRIIPVNNRPAIADKPGDADPVIGSTISGGGSLTGVNEVLANVPEGGTVTLTNAYLQGVDPDNTTVQRQFLLKSVPTQGVLLLNGKLLGVGSTFTQDDIDNNRVTYRHNGGEISAPVSDGLGTYNDIFHFTLSDAVYDDTGAGASNWNSFLITISPTNDAPTLVGPSGTVDIGSATPASNPVSGFVIADPDLMDGIQVGETDFVQATVRLLTAAGTPVTDYVTGLAGGGVDFGFANQAGGLWLATGGSNDILTLQGTRAQVNAALAGLTVTFANDANAMYKIEVIADDRMRDGSGVLLATGSDANGGELNQATTTGGAPYAVPGAVYDWSTNVAVPTSGAIAGNIIARTVDIRVSRVNEPGTLTGPGAETVNEDARTRLTGGFDIADPESLAFDTPVTVTLSIPSGQGTLGIGAAGAATSLTPAGGQAVTISGDNTVSITLTGRAADIKALVNGRNYADSANDANGGLFFTSVGNGNEDYNAAAAGDVTMTVSLNDNGSRLGSDGAAANPANITTPITIDPVNDAPTVAVSAGSVAIVGTTAVSGFVINDVDITDAGGVATGEADFVQATIRLTNSSSIPLPASGDVGGIDHSNVTLSTSAVGHGATVDSTYDGAGKALVIRGTRAQVNAYLAGLQVSLAGGLANSDTGYKVQVVADDRLRDGAGVLDGSTAANGGLNSDGAGGTAAVPTDASPINPYAVVPGGLTLNVATGTRDILPTATNDPGTISVSAVSVNEGAATVALNTTNGNITLADPDDNGAANLTAVVTVPGGFAITAVGGAGGSVAPAAGAGVTSVTITGTEAQINSRLQALTISFPGGSTWNGSFNVTVVYNDQGNSGSRPVALTGDTNDSSANPGDFSYADGVSAKLVTTRTFTVAVNAVNNAPVASGSATLLAVPEDTPGSGGGAATGDTVANLFSTHFDDSTDAVVGGSAANTLAGVAIVGNAATVAQGSWEYFNGAAWVAVGSPTAASPLLLAVGTGVRFVPAADWNGTAPGGLTARLIDNSAGAITTGGAAPDLSNAANYGGTTTFSAATVTLGTSVSAVNDAPLASSSITLATIAEEAPSAVGNTLGSLVTGTHYSDATDTVTSTGGSTATAFAGAAIIGNTANAATEGSWQYFSGGTWITIPVGVADDNALVLSAATAIRFNPVTDYNGTPGGLSIRLSDGTAFSASANVADLKDVSGGNHGGTTGWSSAAVPIGISVSKANDAPGIGGLNATPTFIEGIDTTGDPNVLGTPILLDSSVTIADVELVTRGEDDFNGTTLTLARDNGIGFSASAQDIFGFDTSGTVSLAANVLSVGGTAMADVTSNAAGQLVITFRAAATSTGVNSIASAITYINDSDAPPANVTLRYRFSDDNAGPQGTGGVLTGDATITVAITAQNDPPVATDDTSTLTENTPSVSGNVKTGAGGGGNNLDTDPDNTNPQLSVIGLRTGTEIAGGAMTAVAAATTSANGTSVAGTYGSLTVGADGSYIYTLNMTDPTVNGLVPGDPPLTEVFTYQLADPGPLSDVAQITITITGADDNPTVVIADGNGGGVTGQATVAEPGLTSVGDNSEIVSGTFSVTAPDGIDKITVGGTDVSLAALNTLSGTPVSVSTAKGILKLTGFNSTTGVVAYEYTLTTRQDHSGGEVTDPFAIVIEDRNGDTASGTLTVLITDDVPTANNDTNQLATDATSNVVTGNVIGAGSSGDVTDRLGADMVAGPVTALVFGGSGKAVGTGFATTYGNLVINADGSYVYTLNKGNPAVAALPTGSALTETVTYTITDADGDTSTATLVITVHGPSPDPVSSSGLFGERVDPTIFGNQPPAISQTMGPELFVQLAVRSSADAISLSSAQIADGAGVPFGGEIQSETLNISQGMDHTEHVSRSGVAFSQSIVSDGQARGRAMGNSLVPGADSLFNDFSSMQPFGTNLSTPADGSAADNGSTAGPNDKPVAMIDDRATNSRQADAATPSIRVPGAGLAARAGAASFSARLAEASLARDLPRGRETLGEKQARGSVTVPKASSRA